MFHTPQRFFRVLIFAVIFFLCACSESDSTAVPSADLVLTNGKVYTMDAGRSWADSIAVREGRIVYVGAREGVAKYVGDNTRQIDLAGKMLLPSFQDVHIHPVAGGVSYLGCALFDLGSLEVVLDTVAECVEADPDAPFIEGIGWDWGMFIGSDGPRKELLDEIDNSKPLIIGDTDGHTLWLNSSALEFAGITKDTPDPDGGEIGRDPQTGELTGVLLEGPARNLILQKLPPVSVDKQIDGLRYAQNYLHSLGITAMQDAIVELSGNGVYRSLDAYQAMRDSGELKLRVVAALYWEPGEGLDQIDALSAARAKYSGGLLQAGTVKFWADGILETRTAKLLAPYTDQPDTDGMLMVPLQELLIGIPALDALGFQLHVHAIGDATVRVALDALESARQANGVRDSRHLTAHTQLVHEDDISRFAELDVIAGFSPYWAYNEEYVAVINPPQLGPERMAQMYPINRIVSSGARVAFGSDWYVASSDPLLGIETAVTRVSPHDNDPMPVFLPDERITLDEAIAGYTINAAFANFLDDETGSIEVGKFADLVVLEENLFELEASAISDAGVVATLMEGEVVYGGL